MAFASQTAEKEMHKTLETACLRLGASFLLGQKNKEKELFPPWLEEVGYSYCSPTRRPGWSQFRRL